MGGAAFAARNLPRFVGRQRQRNCDAAQPTELAPASWQAVQHELRLRYLTSNVQAVNNLRQEFDATYWSVATDRGPRDFVTQNLQENALWFSETHILLLDVDGNRFEIKDTSALDAHSRALLTSVL
jgi:hypothetical protein